MLFELVEYLIHRSLHTKLTSKLVEAHKKHHASHRKDELHNYSSFRKSLKQQAAALLFYCSVVYSRSNWFIMYASWSLLVYNSMHLISHTSSWPKVRRYHRAHHVNSKRNLGVSSPVFDWAFGTMSSRFTVHTPILLLLPPPLSFTAVKLAD